MIQRHRLHTLLLVAVSFLLLAPVAHAKDVCVKSYVAAQKLRADNKLLESQTNLQLCAEGRCPTALVKDCSTWLNEVTAAIPRLSIAALGSDGNDTLDVSIEVDGAHVAKQLGTKPLLLDPGKHQLRFVHQGKSIERTIFAQQGMNRTLDVSFAKAKSAIPTAPDDRGHPIAGYVIGLVGLGGLTVSAVYGIPFLRDLNIYNDAVKTKNDACAGGDDSLCTSAPDPGPAPNKSRGVVADVSGIVGGAALAIGGGLIIYHYASGPSDDETESSRDGKHRPSFRPIIGFAPLPGGAFGTVRIPF
jgi:hypothetical protein